MMELLSSFISTVMYVGFSLIVFSISVIFTAMIKRTSTASVDSDSQKESKPLNLTFDISWFKLHMQTSPKTRYGVTS